MSGFEVLAAATAAAAKVDWTAWVNTIGIGIVSWLIKEARSLIRTIRNLDTRLSQVEYHLRLRPVQEILKPTKQNDE
jgi:hypothetical protein